MEKIIKISALFALVVLLAACGSKKGVVNTNTSGLGEELGSTKAHLCWMQDKSSRAVGEGVHFREQAAINTAELQARGTLARKIASAIITVGSEEFGSETIFAGDDNSGRSVSDQSAAAVDRVAGKAKEIIQGAQILEMSRFKQKNNQYKVYVCVGFAGGKQEMAEKAMKGIEQLIPDSQRQKAEANRDKALKRLDDLFAKEGL